MSKRDIDIWQLFYAMLICKQNMIYLLTNVQTNDRWNIEMTGNYMSPTVICDPDISLILLSAIYSWFCWGILKMWSSERIS